MAQPTPRNASFNSLRENPDLDDVFLEARDNVNRPARGQKRKRTKVQADIIRRRAFKVLALLSDLGAPQRLAVLRAAERLNRA